MPAGAPSSGQRSAGPAEATAGAPTSAATGAVAVLDAVTVVRAGHRLLDDVDLRMAHGRPMALLGPNGAGKTTVLRILATRLFPTSGRVEVLGARFGRTDLRTLRPRIGFASVAMHPLLPASQRIVDLVASARRGVLRHGPTVTREDHDAALAALGRVGVAALAGRTARTCSQGEWQRVQIARALVAEPDLLLLDEPFAGLDLGGRESLLADLDALLAGTDAPATIIVAHHLEELPTAVRDATLLRGGRVVATGPVADVLVDESVSATFGVPVRVDRSEGRWTARVRNG